MEDLRNMAAGLRGWLARARQGGSGPARRRHTGRGKLLVRDRVDLLLDPGGPFLGARLFAVEARDSGEKETK